MGCPGPGESARLLVTLSCPQPQGKAMAPSSQTGWAPSGPEFAATSLGSHVAPSHRRPSYTGSPVPEGTQHGCTPFS